VPAERCTPIVFIRFYAELLIQYFLKQHLNDNSNPLLATILPNLLALCNCPELMRNDRPSKTMVYDNMRFAEMVKQLLQRYSVRILLEVKWLIWYKIIYRADSTEAASSPREGGLCGFGLSLLQNPCCFPAMEVLPKEGGLLCIRN
jgi:hypothetical protein